jgi:hypothetical protein
MVSKHTFAAPDHFQNGSELHFCSSEPRLNSIKPFLISSQPKKFVWLLFLIKLAGFTREELDKKPGKLSRQKISDMGVPGLSLNYQQIVEIFTGLCYYTLLRLLVTLIW